MVARRWWWSILLMATMALAGCSGDDGGLDLGPGGVDSQEPDAEEPDADLPGDGVPNTRGGDGPVGEQRALETRAEATFEAFLSADNQAWFDTLSQSCRESLGFVAVSSHLDGRRFRIDLAGIALGDVGVSAVTVDSFDGRRGDVVMVLSGTDQPFVESLPQTWVFENGQWHLDACADIDPVAGGLDEVGTEPDNALGLGFVVDAEGWLIALRDINLDNADLVVEIGGSGPAGDDTTIVTAQVTADWVGAAPSVRIGDELDFVMVDAAGTVYDGSASCAGTGDSWFDPTLELGPGESTPPFFVCREVPADRAGDLLLRIDHLPTGEDWWFDLAG